MLNPVWTLTGIILWFSKFATICL